MSLWIKICGVTSLEDALVAEQAGADAIGLNFVSESPRRVSVDVARGIASHLRDKVELVGVFANVGQQDVISVCQEVALDTAQLHGHEPPEYLEHVSRLVPAYKAVRIATAEDAASASTYGGDRLLTDAKVGGALGGTGQAFDWHLIESLVESRKVIVAGGLIPENVKECVRALFPYGVDTASGVESSPGKKSAEKIVAFVRAARSGESV